MYSSRQDQGQDSGVKAKYDLEGPQLQSYNTKEEITNKSIFKMTNEDLQLFFLKRNIKQPDNLGECKNALNILKDCGYNEGLCSQLNTDMETGIIGDIEDLNRRRRIFGEHSIALPKIQSFLTLLSRQFEDSNVIMLIWAATINLFFSVFSEEKQKYVESLTIFAGLLFSAAISALCDWIKERQYLTLKDEINNQTITVYRGAHGTTSQIQVRELVVGDIIELRMGDRVPADCILVEEMSMKIDQSFYFPGQTEVEKEQSTHPWTSPEGEPMDDNHKSHPDPFLFTDSKVLSGYGKALICAVGKATVLSKNRRPKDLVINEEHTELERKLERTAKKITKYAMAATILSVLTHLVFQIIIIIFTDKTLFSNKTLTDVLKIGIVAFVLMIVAIPEGLPVAVSIAMALSINRLKEDNILIKNLESIQSAAMIHDLCVGKTGILTTGKQQVRKYQVGDKIPVSDGASNNNKANNEFNHDIYSQKTFVSQSRYTDYNGSVHSSKPKKDKQSLMNNTQISKAMKNKLISHILNNTDVRIEMNDEEFKYEPKGQSLEVGMIKFLIDNEIDVPNRFIERNRTLPKITQLPFDQDLRRMTTVRPIIQDSQQNVCIYVKGAPEYLINQCAYIEVNSQGQEQVRQMRADERNALKDYFTELAGGNPQQESFDTTHKILSYAYKIMTQFDFEELLAGYKGDQENEDFRKEVESDLTYLATFGLEDQLRDFVKDSVNTIKFGTTDVYNDDNYEEQNEKSSELPTEVNIRMLSGDHIETCRNMAVQAGIVAEQEAWDEGIVITAEQFRQEIGQIQEIWDQTNNCFRIEFLEGRQRFDSCRKKCKVIARCTSKDKFIFVSGIKQKGGLVGMTGRTISDSEALQKADVGFCMGSGCDVAKDNADLVLLNDDFQSIHSSIKWGRSIFDNVRKFLQYQLTINVVICIITILGGCTTGAPPLTVIQMLWVNLMMDTLGAIGIATEPYRKDQNQQAQKRISRKDNIIKPEMHRQIICQSIYQLLVMIFLMYIGPIVFFDSSYNLVSTPVIYGESPNDRARMTTICFYTFFTMNWFNTINCRLIEKDEINVFTKNLFNNKLFWIIMIIELGVTMLFIRCATSQIGSALFSTAPITSMQELTCWIIGFMTIPLNMVFKKIPLSSFAMFNVDLEDDKKVSSIDKYMDKYNNTVDKASKFIENKEKQEDD